MNIYKGTRTIALRRDLDAMSMYYQERSSAGQHTYFKLHEPPRTGLSFIFHGVILSDCEHFAIDFRSRQKDENNDDSCDILLQIGPRLPQKYIVRNFRLMGKWGPEESSSNLPFQLKRGKSFWMQVLLTSESFYISVNGYHFATYGYHMPYRWLDSVDVCGDVSDILIHTFYVTEYPIRVIRTITHFLSFNNRESKDYPTMPLDWLRIDVPSKFLRHKSLSRTEAHLSLPFYGRIADDVKLTDGRALRIEGRVRIMPHRFSVALQRGFNIWPQPTVSLLFRPSFIRNSRAKVGQAIIARSAFINGAWVNREVSRTHTYLKPGKAFVIIIACRKNFYEVSVNNKLLLTYKHQMNPADIDIVNIRGDVKIWNVVVETARVSRGKSGILSLIGISRSAIK
ncbi:galectin-8 [Drosophila innubila]|uniref:galectin-8 n=1 Tax=Drosophila innubila TaxID=198719 RepID=UPI00148DA190|nr:galectin-8 [Drosophila innubila]